MRSSQAAIPRIKMLAKTALAPWLYRAPSPQLRVERLYLYLDALHQTRALPGAVVEVGCFQGSTAATAHRFLNGIGCQRRYVCVDTFDGFPERQFDSDVKLGTDAALASAFGANSLPLVRKILDRWGCQAIELIKADITVLDGATLPDRIAAALIDVDIAEPTAAALTKLVPRMVPGGVILIDDCDGGDYKGAMTATLEFDPDAEFAFGTGIIRVPKLAASP